MSGTGLLEEVFEISGRGCVVIIGSFEGNALIGDIVQIDQLSFSIAGIELVKFSSSEAAAENKRLRRQGFVLKDAIKAELVKLIGEQVSVLRQADSEE